MIRALAILAAATSLLLIALAWCVAAADPGERE